MVGRLYERVSELLTGQPRLSEVEALLQAAGEFKLISQFPVFEAKIGRRTSGSEHLVCFDQGRVFKATNWGQFGASRTPRAYLRRIVLSNWLFGDTIRLEGVEIDPFGRVRIIISQNFIVGDMASDEAIVNYMERFGFESDDGFWWRRQWEEFVIIVGDLNPENVISTGQMDLVFIDALIDIEPENSFSKNFT